jgi:cytochrome c oxidase subunit 3
MEKYGDMEDVKKGLLITIILGLIFTGVQIYEYSHAPFSIKDGIYGSNFYMLTGFHGAHVIIGTIFLGVCYIRARNNHFTQAQHVGFETAAWYWHFVDVVWLFLFVFVYWWA